MSNQADFHRDGNGPTVQELQQHIDRLLAESGRVSPEDQPVSSYTVEAVLSFLDNAGMLAVEQEWDVEYRHEDGETFLYTDDSFEVAGLSQAEAEAAAAEYNRIDSAPGEAFTVMRRVSRHRRVVPASDAETANAILNHHSDVILFNGDIG